MKLKIKKHTSNRVNARLSKKVRIRKKITGTAERPRLCVYRSLKHIYAQIIDDATGATLVSVSSLTGLSEKHSGKDLAGAVGKEIAKAAASKQIKTVVFDRNGFLYHGRVKALADAAREAGLNF